jgi:pyridoxal phosphate enzyme (YggS family)
VSAIAENLAAVRERIVVACAAADRDLSGVDLLAVSKRHSAASVREAHAAGQCMFGENRVQELAAKAPGLTDLADLQWHMVGSLQTNKVRDLMRIPGLSLIHSLDRIDLADALQRELEPVQRHVHALMQLNVTGESAKHGCTPDAAVTLLRQIQDRCPRVIVTGLMAMGPLEGDPVPVFERVAEVRSGLIESCGLPLPTLSLGMSADLEVAIAAGSTLVRVGTAVFGSRH